MPAGFIEVIGADWFVERFRLSRYAINDILQTSAARIGSITTEALFEVFGTAMDNASLEAFPQVYRTNLFNTLANFYPTPDISGDRFAILLDWDSLGTYEQLSEGFHYHARDTSGNLSPIPYDGRPLKNELDKRYEYWLSLNETWGGNIPAPSALAETYAARVTHWESIGVAPQWLLLNNGQTEFYPTIAPYPIIELVEGRIGRVAYDIVHEIVNEYNEELWGNTYTPSYTPHVSLPTGYASGKFKSKQGLEWIQGPNGKLAGSRRIS